MERLIFSNPIPSKTYLKPSPFLPRLHASKFSLSSRTHSHSHSWRLNSSSRSTPCAKYSANPSSHSFSSVDGDLPDGSVSKPNLLTKIADAFSVQSKAVAAGKAILLSAVFVILFLPAFASPTFAILQTAAKTGVRGELLSSAWTGFFAGCLHTLSGPDHLAALAPLAIGRTQIESAAVGALWGCGHDAGQVIFGLLFLLLKDRLHIEVIRTWGSRVVGFTLLVIGAIGIKEASEVPAPCVVMENGECDVSIYESLGSPTIAPKKKKIGFATFATGIIHGLQPDALIIVLPALALPSRLAGAAFLGMFLVGTVIAMASYTVFIGSCSEALKQRVPRITEKLTWASSLVAIALGLGIVMSEFFGFSLY